MAYNKVVTQFFVPKDPVLPLELEEDGFFVGEEDSSNSDAKLAPCMRLIKLPIFKIENDLHDGSEDAKYLLKLILINFTRSYGTSGIGFSIRKIFRNPLYIIL